MSQESICPKYHKAVELIGRRWTGAIISAMLAGNTRYHEIRECVPDISDRMLAERLRELESEGVLERHVFPTTPVRIEYELTAKGRALEAAIVAIGQWADKWIESPVTVTAVAEH
ncbi:MAG TPA: helix-turn-helix domain-containing protein [Gemmatimonadaceae bacterium]